MTRDSIYEELRKLGFINSGSLNIFRLDPENVKFKCRKSTILVDTDLRIYLSMTISDQYLFINNISGQTYSYLDFLEVVKEHILKPAHTK